MHILNYEELPQGGFAGLLERQFVTDERVFGPKSNPLRFDGIGNFVYLADANFTPKGSTGMHGHKEIDVISVMVQGSIEHAGSLEHGQTLHAGMVQIQRAGGEGFRHDEINPDASENHMIQLWVLPDDAGEPAGYQVFTPQSGERLQVYGGSKSQTERFYSRTSIDVALLKQGKSLSHRGEVMVFLCSGEVLINGQKVAARTLVRADSIELEAVNDAQIILIYSAD
ncbi:MAG: pilus assembly protein [SAR86 cluster bacterium]|uniref:Pilus assembly protein n=1 Tax=SAR86 cluster bacterium TaxID=2030880 RepID=A0A2A4MSC9_9GAMM|nr:MAG: pilus assembly protein [SAR86 cluster bacterium]